MLLAFLLRKSFFLTVVILGIFLLFTIFISLITGKKIAVTYITLLNLLALPFVWILDHLGYNYDSFVRRTALV